MRHTSVAVALLATAVIGGVAAVPAHASAGAVARAVWIKSCYDKKIEDTVPCGHWQLIMRDGSKRKVADVAVFSTDAKGRKGSEPGRFALSGDGRWIVYERASDHRIVVRRAAGGAVTELPRSVVPKGIGTLDLGLYLSPAGDRLLVNYVEEAEREPGKVVTIATGAVTKLPAKDIPSGFSADGDEVLGTRAASDNTTTLLAYRLDGSSIRSTPPQVVAAAAVNALAADGRTVASIVSGNADAGKPPRLRIYDIKTGEMAPGVALGLKPAQTPYHAAWSGEGRLTVKVQSGDEGDPATIRVYSVDVVTGAVTRQDSFRISKTYKIWYGAGE